MQPPTLPFPGVSQRPRQRPRTKRNGPALRWFHTALPLLAAAIAGAGCFLALTHGGRNTRDDPAVSATLERVARIAGFALDEVRITGHAFTSDADVYDAVDLDNVRSFFALDTAAVRSRIERLPWVATANLTRVYPDRLDITITERKPFAVWHRGAEENLIDRTGRVLALIRPGTVSDLPQVAGENANLEAATLFQLLNRFAEVKNRLESSEWVGGRRWTLHLANDVTLHLPSDRASQALETIAARGGSSLISQPGRIIDMRAPTRVAVRPVARDRVSSIVVSPAP